MVYESSLMQASQFSDSLSIRPSATSAEKPADENAQTAKNPEQGGDTISISAEARALIAPQKSDDSKEFKGDADGKPSNQTPGQGGESAEGGEGITISNESMAAQSKANKSESKSLEEQSIDRLKEQIQRLKEEIKALEDGDLPEKEKSSQVQAKQAQLMELNDQLLKAQQEQNKANGQASGGGTRANGFGNSVSSF